MKQGITVHCVVKNEEKWIWYALNSILEIASKVLIYDTGSTDKTVEIIKTIKSKKIIFEEKGEVNAEGLVKLRRQQLEGTQTEWFLILDGDEIWPDKTKKELVDKLKTAKENDWGVVIRAWNLVGDIYHYHPESIRYHWPFAPTSYKGWANLRVIHTQVPGLHIQGKYPLEAYCDKNKTPLQNYGQKNLIFLKNRYFHTTYLTRSSSRSTDKKILNRLKKNKYEFGIKFPKNFKYPKVFYIKHPGIVTDPWLKRSSIETITSLLQSPIKELRRRAFNLYNTRV